MAFEMSDALDTLKSVANTGVAVASRRPAAKADRGWQSRRSVEEESLNINCVAFGMAGGINQKIKAVGGWCAEKSLRKGRLSILDNNIAQLKMMIKFL